MKLSEIIEKLKAAQDALEHLDCRNPLFMDKVYELAFKLEHMAKKLHTNRANILNED